MRRYLSLCVSAVLLFSPDLLFAQEYDFFWSTLDLNQGATNSELVVSATPGQTLSLFLYYSSNGVSNQNLDGGALLDIATSRPDIIKFVTAESFNFPVSIQDFDITFRWYCPSDPGNELGAAGEIGCLSDELLDEWGAFGLTSMGMLDNTANGLFLDRGYDIAADAFLFGRIDIEIVGELGQCVQILSGRGQGGIVIGDGFDAEFFEPVFGGCVISLGDVLLADVNQDGSVDLLDIPAFVEAISAMKYQVQSDINCDGSVDLLDVPQFVNRILGDGLHVPDPTVENEKPQHGMLGDINIDGFLDLLDGECYRKTTVDCGSFATGDINMDGTLDLLDAFLYVDLMASPK